MKILLIDITNKISEELIPKLLKRGHEIVEVSRDPEVHNNRYNIEMIKCDLFSEIDVPHKIDCIIHLASDGPYNAENTENNFEDCYYNNIIVTNNVLKFAVENGVKRVIYASTVEIYGQPPKYFPVKEHHPLNPQSDYAISKLCGEQLCGTYKKIYGIEIVILRISAMYGKNMPDKHFLKRLVAELKHKKEIEVYNLESKFSLIHIKDVSDIIVKALDGPSGAYNVASLECITHSDFINAVCTCLNKQIILKEIKSNEKTTAFCFGIEKIMQYYDWTPKIKLEEGVIDIIEGV